MVNEMKTAKIHPIIPSHETAVGLTNPSIKKNIYDDSMLIPATDIQMRLTFSVFFSTFRANCIVFFEIKAPRYRAARRCKPKNTYASVCSFNNFVIKIPEVAHNSIIK